MRMDATADGMVTLMLMDTDGQSFTARVEGAEVTSTARVHHAARATAEVLHPGPAAARAIDKIARTCTDLT